MPKTELNINSSALSAAWYNEETEELGISWGGGWYIYQGVPASVAEDLENAGSQGAFANEIKNEYSYRRG